MNSCTKHPHEHGTDLCRRCGMPWCGDCLVYVYGENKPPFCIGCAMFAGGVRTSNVLPAMSRRELRARRKAAKAEAKAAKRPAVQSTPSEPDDAPEPERIDATSRSAGDGVDWSTPWWEQEREPTLTD